MPVHHWANVDDGAFHDFHSSWITHLKEALNEGLLPKGYFAMSEQHAGRAIADVLTLKSEGWGNGDSVGGTAVLSAAPKVGRRLKAPPQSGYRALRKTIAIRHVSGQRVVAMIEIVSPANKDRQSSIDDFVRKSQVAIENGCHLLVIDLFPPGPVDPAGIHQLIWEWPDEEGSPSIAKPLTLAAYMAAPMPEAVVENIDFGDPLPSMPLYLDLDRYIEAPLESTYMAAFRGVPEFYRQKLAP